MDLKIKFLTASITRLFGFFALFQIPLLFLFPIEGFSQKGLSHRENFTCISKHTVSDVDKTAVAKLTTELQPSLFIDNGIVNSFSKTPSCLFTDTISLSKWPTALPVAGIELVQIKITKAEQLQNTFDLSVLTNFPKLNYIHILSEIDITAATVRELFKNVPPHAIVLFTVEKPS